ncbi:VOC family protein [Bacillus lacus]|uniref:VOC family protein n=1 Tax=Metabacillus lacus TaxID=1983721 RepID=A0A7X2IWH1_9BACI|nr:VOC family protein [Metabacillus lacus]MRX71086.1 VOC family protein [Metabacillus lacus]
MNISGIHHVAVICSNYEVSKVFYTDILGLEVVKETYRQERDSYKLDLAVGGVYQIELFSFPNPPERATNPEAAGLRHLAFRVENLQKEIERLKEKGIPAEPVRIDDLTGKRFTFFKDPDGLPLELYEG